MYNEQSNVRLLSDGFDLFHRDDGVAFRRHHNDVQVGSRDASLSGQSVKCFDGIVTLKTRRCGVWVCKIPCFQSTLRRRLILSVLFLKRSSPSAFFFIRDDTLLKTDRNGAISITIVHAPSTHHHNPEMDSHHAVPEPIQNLGQNPRTDRVPFGFSRSITIIRPKQNAAKSDCSAKKTNIGLFEPFERDRISSNVVSTLLSRHTQPHGYRFPHVRSLVPQDPVPAESARLICVARVRTLGEIYSKERCQRT